MLASCSMKTQTIEYFDADWKKVDSGENAAYYREITYDTNGRPTSKVRDYFITGELQFEGRLLSVDPHVFDGVCTWYYQNGHKRQQITYERGRATSTIRTWSEAGKEEGVFDVSGLFFSRSYLSSFLEEMEQSLSQDLAFDSTTRNFLLGIGGLAYENRDYYWAKHISKITYDLSNILGDSLSMTLSLGYIGRTFDAESKYQEALTWYLKAAKIQERYEAKAYLADSYNSIGGVYHNTGKYEEALNWYNKSRQIRESLELEAACANSYNNIGELKRLQGKFEEAISLHQLAIEIRVKKRLEKLLASSYNNIGEVYFSMGDYPRARSWYNQARAIGEKLDLKGHLVRSYNKIGTAYQAQGIYDQALVWYHKAKEKAELLNFQRELAKSYNNIATVHESKGDLSEALKWHQQATEIRERLGLEVDLSGSYNNIGGIFAFRTEFEEALVWYYKAKEIRERLGLELDLAYTYNHIGGVYYQQGKYEEALVWYHKSKDLREKYGLRSLVIISYNNIGLVHRAQKDYLEALDWFNKARSIEEKHHLENGLASSYNNIGLTYQSAGYFRESLEFLHRAREIQEKLELERDLTTSYYNLSSSFWLVQEMDSALLYAQKSIHLNEQIREANASHTDRQLFVSKSMSAIELGITSAFSIGKVTPAFAISEKGKARGLSDILSEKGLHETVPLPDSLLVPTRVILNRIQAIEKELATDLVSEKRSRLRKQRKVLFQNWQELQAQIRTVAPEYSNLIYETTVQADHLQSVLSKDEVLVSYFVGTVNTFVFLITSSALEMIDLGPSDSLKRLIDQFQSEFIPKQKLTIKRNDPLTQGLLDEQFFKLSHDFYKKLWLPFDSSDLLLNKKIVLIPDGFLNYLPFELLIKDNVQKDYQNYYYLVQDHPISYYPSATLLYSERTKEKQVEPPPKDFFGLGVSQFTDINCTIDGNAYSNLSSIAASINRLRDLFSSNLSAAILDEQVTEGAFKSLDLVNYRYLHFATHGVINTETPDFSSILLQPDDQEDGCLNMYEIFDLNFNADLVTLAACQTGIGKLVHGEGMVGFTRALMYAGTPSVILSLWEVTDESTNQLFLDYYLKLAKDGSDKYAPLRATQLGMIKSGEYSNPYYWAPFVFIGTRDSKWPNR